MKMVIAHRTRLQIVDVGVVINTTIKEKNTIIFLNSKYI